MKFVVLQLNSVETENISFIKMRILLQRELQNIISSRYIISGAKRLEVIRAWGL